MKRRSHSSPRRASKSPTRTFLEKARRQFDMAPAHVNAAVALYIELVPKIQTLSLFDLQIFAADMEEAARVGEQEAIQVNTIVDTLDALAPEPTPITPLGF